MNQPIQPPIKDGCFYIDNSQMELFTTCARQSYYYTIRRLELNKSKIALQYGQNFHTVLEQLYKKHGTNYRSQEENIELIKLARSLPLATPEGDYRTSSYLADAIDRYTTQYPAEGWSIAQLPNGRPGIEVPFAVPVGAIETRMWGRVVVIWIGKIDLVYRSDGKLGIMDHKTTSMMGPQFFTEFEIAHQIYGYANAIEDIFDEQVHEFTINGLGCRKPTRTGTQFEFVRHTIPITREHLAEWNTDTLALVSDFFAHCERGYFPKCTKWCVGKYGACQYRAVCTMKPEHRELALSTNEFRPVTWTPLSTQES